MKTFRLIGMAVLAMIVSVGFASCSDDEEPESDASKALVGTWELVKTEIVTNVNGEEVDRDVEVYTGASIDCVKIFDADKKIYIWNGTPEGKWSMTQSGTWKFSSGNLFLTFGSQKQIIKMHSISSTELVMQYPEEWIRNYEDNGIWKEETRQRTETLRKNDNWDFFNIQ